MLDQFGTSATSESDKDHRASGIQGNPGTPCSGVLSHKLSFTAAATAKAQNTTESRLAKFVKGDVFDASFSFLIFANAVVMALDNQYNGHKNGGLIKYYLYDVAAIEAGWPQADEAFCIIEWIFGIIFTLEIVLKLAAFRCEFWFDAWNYIDALIVGAWMVTAVGSSCDNESLQTTSTSPFPINPTMLRVARLVRLLRLAKLVRAIKGFDSLFMMTTAMTGSMSVLLWAVVLLVLVLMMVALFLQMTVQDFISDSSNDDFRREQVFQYYGTFGRSMLTMFELTLGNWMPPSRALVENMGEVWIPFFVMFKLTIGFSVVSVITGVFIQETFTVATTDDRIMLMKKERSAKIHTKKMEGLMRHGDEDGDGALTLHEFRHVMEDKAVRTWLASMELEIRDVDKIFMLLDPDGDGRLTAPELVAGVSRLKGAARSIDLNTLQHEVRQLHLVMRDLMAGMKPGTTRAVTLRYHAGV